MNRSTFIIFMFILLLISSIGLSYSLYSRSYSSTLTYSIDITVNDDIQDMKFLIPLPHHGKSAVIHRTIETNLSDIRGWTLALTETEYGTMLEFLVHSITADHPLNISITLPTDHEIDTKNPLTSEPIFLPKNDLNQIECPFPHPDWDYLSCYTYTSMLYVDFNATPVTELSIAISIHGRNSWWVFGWSGNEYSDELYLSLEGEHHDWVPIPGSLTTGFGRYNPFF